MAQFRWRDETVSILVEMPQSFEEIVGSVGVLVFDDRLVDGQEYFKRNPVLWKFFSNLVSAIHLLRDSQLTRLVLGGEFPDIGLGGILSEGSKSVSDLSHLDFAIAPVVKQLESLLEFCNKRISLLMRNGRNKMTDEY